MNLDKLTIAIRPRRDWEAVDLGILMARRWWWPMVKVWCLLSLPLFLLSFILPLSGLIWLPALLWWLKPLLERPLLMLLSQSVFGDQPSTKELLKASPRLFLKQLIASLTWRRLSPHRAMDLAVLQLEDLNGAQRRARLAILHRHDDAPSKWLTLIGVHLESFLLLALVTCLYALIPNEIDVEIYSTDFWFAERTGLILQFLFYYLACAAVAPFYIACGFSLYLNRRVKLEGWDIEIAFKQMLIKRQLSTLTSTLVLLSSVGLLCLGLLPLKPQNAYADVGVSDPSAENENNQLSPFESDRRELQKHITDIIEGPDFHQKLQQQVWQLKPTEKPDNETNNLFIDLLGKLGKALANALSAIAPVAELILWAIVITAIVYFAVKYRQYLSRFGGWQRTPKGTQYQPKTLFGMDIQKESLPDNVSAHAQALWQQQEYRAALALLYRASLAQLLEHGLPLHDGCTEQECLHLAEQHAPALALSEPCLRYFKQLTYLWRALAYGHKQPDRERALMLCQQWNNTWLKEASHGQP